MSYPVQLEVTSPARFDRIQLLLRLAISCALGWVSSIAGWLPGLVFVALPLIAAVALSTRGAQGYLDKTGPAVWRVVSWLIGLSAYMLLLTDRFPTTESTGVRIDLQVGGKPTIGSALLRLILSIPSAVVLGLLGIVSWLLIIVGAVMILIDNQVPAGILAFQRGVLRWQARLLAYHASLVDEYPPFSFEADVPRPGDQIHAS